jgi:hypothetical protein
LFVAVAEATFHVGACAHRRRRERDRSSRMPWMRWRIDPRTIAVQKWPFRAPRIVEE